MTRTFIQTKEFSKRWDELGLNDDDLRKLELDLLTDPQKYPVIVGTGGLRKARIALENRGKSGGARVCYVDYVFAETIYLITVYPKNVKDDLSMDEKKLIKNVIDKIEKSLRGGV